MVGSVARHDSRPLLQTRVRRGARLGLRPRLLLLLSRHGGCCSARSSCTVSFSGCGRGCGCGCRSRDLSCRGWVLGCALCLHRCLETAGAGRNAGSCWWCTRCCVRRKSRGSGRVLGRGLRLVVCRRAGTRDQSYGASGSGIKHPGSVRTKELHRLAASPALRHTHVAPRETASACLSSCKEEEFTSIGWN